MKRVKTFTLSPQFTFHSLTFSPDTLAAAVSIMGPRTKPDNGRRLKQSKLLAVYSVPSFDQMARVTLPKEDSSGFQTITFSSGSEYLALGMTDGSVLIQDWPHYKTLVTLNNHEGYGIDSISFSQKKAWMATSGNDRKTNVYSVPHFELHKTMPSQRPMRAKFSPDSEHLAVYGKRNFEVWDAPFDHRKELQTGELTPVCSFSPEGRFLAVMDEETDIYELQEPKLKPIIKRPSFHKVKHLPANEPVPKDTITYFSCFSPDSEYFVSFRKATEIYSVPAFSRIKRLEHLTQQFGYGGFTPDSEYLMTLGVSELVVYDTETFSPVRTIRYDEDFCTISPDMKYLVTTANQKTVMNVYEIQPTPCLPQPM